jgi:hypothetical protein
VASRRLFVFLVSALVGIGVLYAIARELRGPTSSTPLDGPAKAACSEAQTLSIGTSPAAQSLMTYANTLADMGDKASASTLPDVRTQGQKIHDTMAAARANQTDPGETSAILSAAEAATPAVAALRSACAAHPS